MMLELVVFGILQFILTQIEGGNHADGFIIVVTVVGVLQQVYTDMF